MGRSESFGKRAARGRPSSVVRVYEREDLDRICYTCAWMTTGSGRPIERYLPPGTTWDAAVEFGELTWLERRKAILRGAAADPGPEAPPVTLQQLFDAYREGEEAANWSARHRADVEYSLLFWLRVLGPDVDVLALTPAAVRKEAGDAGRDRGHSPRWAKKRLANLRAAVRWGAGEARLYDGNPLDGLRMPEYEPQTDALFYSPAEAALLLQPHAEIDWRCTLLANIAADTGRRLSAMLALTAEDVVTDGARVLLHFRGAFDKGGREAFVPVSVPTAELLADALEHDLVEEWGWLFPEGRLDHDDPRDKPWGTHAAIDALHAAEEVVGVPYVRKRAYHGLKRAHVTAAMEVAHGDTALVGDQTGNVSAELLRRVYRKANRRRQTGHVDAVRKAIETPESTRESTHDEEG